MGVTLRSLNRQTKAQLLRPCPFFCSFILSLVHSAGECLYVPGARQVTKQVLVLLKPPVLPEDMHTHRRLTQLYHVLRAWLIRSHGQRSF